MYECYHSFFFWQNRYLQCLQSKICCCKPVCSLLYFFKEKNSIDSVDTVPLLTAGGGAGFISTFCTHTVATNTSELKARYISESNDRNSMKFLSVISE